MMKLTNKDYILFASIIVNLILAYWIFDITREDPEIDKELQRSKGRVEVLEKQLKGLELDYDSLSATTDSLNILVKEKPKERIKINTVYDEKIIRVISLNVDSSVRYVARRLSEIDFN